MSLETINMSDKILAFTIGLVIGLGIIVTLAYLTIRYKRNKAKEMFWAINADGDLDIQCGGDFYVEVDNGNTRRELDKDELDRLKVKRAGKKNTPKDGLYIGEFDKPAKGTSKEKAKRLKAKARRKKKDLRTLGILG